MIWSLSPTYNTAEIIISKHRNGSLGSVNLQFLKEYVKFVDNVDFSFRNTPGDRGDIFGDGGNGFITRSSALNTLDSDDDFFTG